MRTRHEYALRYRGLTLLEVSVAVLVLVALTLILIIVPSAPRRRPAHRMQNSIQLRGIHQALVVYAQSNKGHYVGLDSKGEVINASVAYRFQKLLESRYFTPDYAISPSETANIVEWIQPAQSDADVAVTITTSNYSYAMLQIDQPGGRQNEWHETLNTEAIVLSDRNTSASAPKPTSIHSDADPWNGSVAWNDNHVSFEKTHVFSTAYRNAQPGASPFRFPQDNLFEASTPNDAWLIHQGQ